MIAAAATLLQGSTAFAAEGQIVIESVRNRERSRLPPAKLRNRIGSAVLILYLLHGGGGAPSPTLRQLFRAEHQGRDRQPDRATHVIREMIVVMPDIATAYREFILNDVITHTDTS